MLKFIILSIIPILLFAQNPRDYFPSHLGDMWQYIDSDGYYVNYTIVKDSLDSIGNEYVDFKVNYISIAGSYLENYMIDTLNQVYLLDEYSFSNGRYLLYDLKKRYGERFQCDSYDSLYGGFPFAMVIDTTVTSKTFFYYLSSSEDGNPDSAISTGGEIILTAGIGRTWQQGDLWSESLNGAIIDGIQYGTIYYDTTAINEHKVKFIPTEPEIIKTYPNPFNSQVKIEYFLPNSGRLTIEIYNILGQKVSTLFNGYARKGQEKIIWNGTIYSQQPAPSGLYFVQLYFNGEKIIKRILLVK